MATSHTSPAKLETQHPLFAANPAFAAQIVQALHVKRWQRGSHISSHGDEAGFLWLVYRGWVKLTRQTPDGKETIIGLCSEGDVFGEAALFAGASYPYTAEIIEDGTEIAAIPAALIRTAMAQDANLSKHIMAMLNERMQQARLKLEHMSTMTAAQRLACFFLNLCRSEMNGSKMLHIPVDKNILAAYLGMKPETLSRSQQQLKSVGIAVAGPDVTINDIGKLRAFTCGSCSESGSCEVEDGLS